MGYAILLNFLVYVTLPVPLYFAGILLGIGTFTIYVASLIGLARSELYFWHEVGVRLCVREQNASFFVGSAPRVEILNPTRSSIYHV